MKAGIPSNPLALVPKSRSGGMAKSIQLKAVDHGILIKLNVAPSAVFVIDAPNDCNLGKFYRGEFHKGLKYDDVCKTSCGRHAAEIAKVLEEKSKDKTLLCMNEDGGGGTEI